jgi:hypothetical protein
MNTKLRFLLEEAINNVLQDNCEDNLWDGYLHDELAQQMATAAEQVFDSAMKSQEFLKKAETE